MVLRFTVSSITTVGVLLGVVFLPGMLNELLIAAVRASWWWAHALRGVLFAVAAIWSFANPDQRFPGAGLSAGAAAHLRGDARQHQLARDQGRQ